MPEITPVYMAKDNDAIIATATYFSVAQSHIVDDIIENTCDWDKEAPINNEFDGIEINGEWYSAFDIVNALGDVDDTFRSIVESAVEEMCDMDVGTTEFCEYDYNHSISCGLKIVDDDGVSHVVDDEDLEGLDNEPIKFTAIDGTEWNIAVIGGNYTIVPDEPEKNHAIFLVRNQSNGIPMVGGGEYFGFDKEKFDARLIELHSVGAMLLNVFENDEIVTATVYL